MDLSNIKYIDYTDTETRDQDLNQSIFNRIYEHILPTKQYAPTPTYNETTHQKPFKYNTIYNINIC